eukprot:scaffold122012_cov75-Phaeocystis_antarctica.AAC.1
MSHWHVPLKHVPCPVQLEGHSPRTPAQSSPKKPTSHKQLKVRLAPERPAAHSPWPEQFLGHTPSTTEQSAPSKPASQRHSPKAHAPWPEQLAAQPPNAATTPQSSPWKPGSQRQRPCPVPGSLSRKHSPCAEQLDGQPPTTMLQSPPEYPKSHSHSPANGAANQECWACAGCSRSRAGLNGGRWQVAGRARVGPHLRRCDGAVIGPLRGPAKAGLAAANAIAADAVPRAVEGAELPHHVALAPGEARVAVAAAVEAVAVAVAVAQVGACALHNRAVLAAKARRALAHRVDARRSRRAVTRALGVDRQLPRRLAPVVVELERRGQPQRVACDVLHLDVLLVARART